MTSDSLGQVLRAARSAAGLSLRGVEARTGIHNAHLSQIENDVITKPEMAMLWDLATVYDLQYSELLRLAGYASGGEVSKRSTQRMTVALRALSGMSPRDQDEVLEFMASLRKKRDEPT